MTRKLDGEWWVIMRKYMDLVMVGEPYFGLVMMVNTSSAQYILRVLGTSRYLSNKAKCR